MLTAGIQVVERNTLGLATVLVRKGKGTELAARVRERFGVELPHEPRRVVASATAPADMGAGANTNGGPGVIAFAGTAPGAWLALRQDAGADFASCLAEHLAGLASVSDQSDGLSVLRISGPNVRDALCKIVPIDLHPRELIVNQVAATIVGHMPVTMWRLPDDADGTAIFEIATFRSCTASFRYALG